MTLTYQEKASRAAQEFHLRRPARMIKGGASNLFRKRTPASKSKALDLSGFNQVLRISTDDGQTPTVEVEGSITYEDLVAETLKHGFMPAVVPQLKTITPGGAVVGLGIEATSFKSGLVPETVIEMDVITPGHDKPITCSRKENPKLFRCMANSYGTLGRVIRLKMELTPVKRSVGVFHIKYQDPKNFFGALNRACNWNGLDFVEGVVFGEGDMFITCAEHKDDGLTAPHHAKTIYYKTIKDLSEPYFYRPADWLWRWDPDWFWCSKAFGAQDPLLRRLWPRRWLRSDVYWRLMNWNQRWNPFQSWSHSETVVQDVQIPIERAPQFLEWLMANIPIRPIWICPWRPRDDWPLIPIRNPGLHINFGFWGSVPSSEPPDHHNKKLERNLGCFDGIKSLYSKCCFTREQFWRIYDLLDYHELKREFDPNNSLPHLYTRVTGKE